MSNQKHNTIGRTIKVLRAASAISQKDLAERAGIKPNYLSLVESGKREPSLSVLRTISEELHVPMSFLFWESAIGSDDANVKLNHIVDRIKQLLLQVESLRVADLSKKSR
jgi:transcriptional regulator with XRE-family HTH domain